MRIHTRLGGVCATALLAFTVGLTGCDDGDDGERGPRGPEGPPGPGAFPEPGPTASGAEPDLTVDIQGVTIASAPVLEFTAHNQDGDPVELTQEDVSARNLRFTITKLIPATPTSTGQPGSGDPSHWQSYINEVEQPDVGPGTEPTVQADYENSGTLTVIDQAEGRYQYEFGTDVANVTDPIDVPFEPSLVHRVAMQVEFEGETFEIVDNPICTFVPGTSGTQQACVEDTGEELDDREITTTETCNGCHQQLAIHGGGRREIKYCSQCHNQGTVDANSGENVALSVMIHKIHMGEQLPSVEAGGEFAIWGFRDSKHDYSNVVWPGFPIGSEPPQCTKCHTGENPATPDGDNWKTKPSIQACGSCHDDVSFAEDVPEDMVAHSGSPQDDNSLCAECHPPDTGGVLGANIADVHSIFLQEQMARFAYQIDNVSYNSGTGEVTVDFRVVDPTQGDDPYDILSDPEWTSQDGAAPGASRLALDVAWPTEDFSNQGSGAIIDQPQQPIPFPEPGIPMSVNLLDPANVTDNGDGSFRTTVQLPDYARNNAGSGRVALEGHAAVVNEADEVEEAPITGVFEDFAINDASPQSRRQVVSIDNCNQCHIDLSLHGNNRTNEPQLCVMCHTPNATDVVVRPATLDENEDGIFDDFTATGKDGKREQAIDFKVLIHGIHAGAQETFDGEEAHGFREDGLVVWGFGRFSENDYSHVRYPGILSNCEACHVNESYQLTEDSAIANVALGTTVQSADAVDVLPPVTPIPVDNQAEQNQAEADLADPTEDLNATPMASTCSACHDGEQARNHMVSTGGASFAMTQQAIDMGATFEGCAVCHGPGRSEDVGEVHPKIGVGPDMGG